MAYSILRFGIILGALLVLLHVVSLVQAVPFWEPGVRQTSDTSITGQLSYLIANVPRYQPQAAHSKHLTTFQPGHPGNITLVPGTEQPGLFHLYRHQLYNYVNDTFIYPVAAVNVSATSPDEPLQLVAGEHGGAVLGGRWRWAGTRLMYDLGVRTNRGLYYACPDGGVYLNMQEAKPPQDCSVFSLHYSVDTPLLVQS
ncbi:hypothetical protein HDZ31DRAFT_31968 [Schizophyllum fasciatum]